MKAFRNFAKVVRLYSNLYTTSHEYVTPTGEIGLSNHAADALGDIIHMEILVEEGEEISQGDVFAEVESVKSVSECYSPASGTVEALNAQVEDDDTVAICNQDAEGAGWIIKVAEGFEAEGLMDTAAFEKMCEDEH